MAVLFLPPPGEIWGQGTNASYCQMYGGDNCKYREAQGRCFENVTDSSSTLQILDGNDFFDIAVDRYRCFDPLTVDCTAAMIMEAILIVTGCWL